MLLSSIYFYKFCSLQTFICVIYFRRGGENVSINDRLRSLRKEILKLTQDEFAKRISVSRSNLGNIEIGNIAVTDRVIATICSVFHVNEDWLRSGEGEPLIPLTRNQVIEDYVSRVMKDETAEFQKFIIELMSSLPVECWEAIEAKAQELRKK